MKTAVDTSVLQVILNNEPDGDLWLARLIDARSEGSLVCCEVVYAEFAPSFESQAELDEALSDLGVEFEQIGRGAAFRAGQIFADYRRRGGPRRNMVGDFLIGAHAMIQADRLAANDNGYLRTYFSKLTLVKVAT